MKNDSQTKRVFRVSIYALGLVLFTLILSFLDILPNRVLTAKILQLAIALNLLYLSIVIYQLANKGLFGRALMPVVYLIAGWLAVAIAVKMMVGGSVTV
ncbi:hypothetical protein [Dyadobacter bucti]|uniref:hypothetical protein n=1 Tax=Dyadobacter bucti TaxID=2572203 RepID=UPI001107CDB7|nr:hypothetical protein [Dyadobacter bucti]